MAARAQTKSQRQCCWSQSLHQRCDPRIDQRAEAGAAHGSFLLAANSCCGSQQLPLVHYNLLSGQFHEQFNEQADLHPAIAEPSIRHGVLVACCQSWMPSSNEVCAGARDNFGWLHALQAGRKASQLGPAIDANSDSANAATRFLEDLATPPTSGAAAEERGTAHPPAALPILCNILRLYRMESLLLALKPHKRYFCSR